MLARAVRGRSPRRLDVTRATAGSDGLPFAPSSKIVWPMIALRRRGPAAVELAWPGYVEAYTKEMRSSWCEHRPAWDALLARDEVTLVCYCTDAARCHRTVLAGILVKLGARYDGERTATRRSARAEEKRANIEWLGNAILTRVGRGQRPHFRLFATVFDGAVTLWPRPTEASR